MRKAAFNAQGSTEREVYKQRSIQTEKYTNREIYKHRKIKRKQSNKGSNEIIVSLLFQGN
jgi:hypothetical protein